MNEKAKYLAAGMKLAKELWKNFPAVGWSAYDIDGKEVFPTENSAVCFCALGALSRAFRLHTIYYPTTLNRLNLYHTAKYSLVNVLEDKDFRCGIGQASDTGVLTSEHWDKAIENVLSTEYKFCHERNIFV